MIKNFLAYRLPYGPGIHRDWETLEAMSRIGVDVICADSNMFSIRENDFVAGANSIQQIAAFKLTVSSLLWVTRKILSRPIGNSLSISVFLWNDCGKN